MIQPVFQGGLHGLHSFRAAGADQGAGTAEVLPFQRVILVQLESRNDVNESIIGVSVLKNALAIATYN